MAWMGVSCVARAPDRPRRRLAAVRVRALKVTLHRNLLGKPGKVAESRGKDGETRWQSEKKTVVNPPRVRVVGIF